ncbi:hypothetical protein E4T42_03856 [Aureobasidium subglaciale]|nr:hypothetical protein E4T42_03856 [Aureobasidium subglaciale]
MACSQEPTTPKNDSATASKPQFKVSNQADVRHTSDAHVLPVQEASNADVPSCRGLSESTKALARQLLNPEQGSGHDYDPDVFPASTRWLMNSVNETERALASSQQTSFLTETAVRKHNKKCIFLEKDSDDENDAKDTPEDKPEGKPKERQARRIDAWVSEQIEGSDATP